MVVAAALTHSHRGEIRTTLSDAAEPGTPRRHAAAARAGTAHRSPRPEAGSRPDTSRVRRPGSLGTGPARAGPRLHDLGGRHQVRQPAKADRRGDQRHRHRLSAAGRAPRERPACRAGRVFRRYLDARLAAYRRLPDVEAAYRELAMATAIQDDIWKQTVAAIRTSDAPSYAAMMVLPPLNAMFDIATTRTMAAQIHTPVGIFIILFVLALVGALLSGYALAADRSGSWLHIVCFVLVIVSRRWSTSGSECNSRAARYRGWYPLLAMHPA